jgi:transporter family-2 protein
MTTAALTGSILAVIIGAFLPLQALINAQLGRATSGALFASFVSFLVGTVSLGVVLLAMRTPLPGLQSMTGLPPWAWLGGVIGAIYVFSATLLVPRIGAAALICLVVFGQVVGSLLLDHHGVLSPARSADGLRILGGALVAIGAVLVVQPWKAA